MKGLLWHSFFETSGECQLRDPPLFRYGNGGCSLDYVRAAAKRKSEKRGTRMRLPVEVTKLRLAGTSGVCEIVATSIFANRLA